MTVRSILAKIGKTQAAMAAVASRFFADHDAVPTDTDLLILSLVELIPTLSINGAQQLLLLEQCVHVIRDGEPIKPFILVLLDDELVLINGQLPRRLSDMQVHESPLPAWIRMVTYNLTHLVLINKLKRWQDEPKAEGAYG